MKENNYPLEYLHQEKNLNLVWKNEARDFTPWLSKHLDILAKSIGTGTLKLIGTEQDADGFKVDILAEEISSNRKVVIENQIYDTDHDHLGKAITYAAWKDASIIVWISRKARAAHRRAIKWLNEHTDSKISFYLIEIELWRIGNSGFAPRFNIIEQPKEIQKGSTINSVHTELNETGRLLVDFWEAFVEYASDRADFTKVFNLHKVWTADTWYTLAVGFSRFYINLSIRTRKKVANAGIYFSNCINDYQQFASCDNLLNNIFGQAEIIRSESGKTDRSLYVRRSADISDRTSWNDIFEWYIKTALQFKEFIKEVTGR